MADLMPMKLKRVTHKGLYRIVAITILICSSCTHEADITEFPEVCFTSEILPVFQNSCAMTGCHDRGGESGYILNSYTGIMDGIKPGNSAASPIYKAITSKWGENKMPPDQPLSLENRIRIRLWIDQGAAETTCPGAAGNPENIYVPRACFSRDIQPVVVSHCASAGCHDAITKKEGYTLTTFTAIRSIVVPGNKSSSKLYRVITTSSGEDKMPPAGSPQLTAVQIDSIGKWINYGALNENCGEVCDTINPVTFSGVINPVLQLSCTGCHSGAAPSGSINLSNYASVAAVASTGKLIASLKGSGVTRMPPSGSLSTCRIRQFQLWINNGYLNN